MTPAAQADRRTLIRRATYDMTGLPPTEEEVEAFVRDKSSNAWEKVVDRLLASPRYGERWGRHWLDVARYSEDDVRGLDPKAARLYAVLRRLSLSRLGHQDHSTTIYPTTAFSPCSWPAIVCPSRPPPNATTI